ncbi:MAG: hypothetical protein ACI8SE_001581, partial [Bacteroidia bacterium]
MKKWKTDYLIKGLMLWMLVFLSTYATSQTPEKQFTFAVGWGVDTSQTLNRQIAEFVEGYINEFANCNTASELDRFWHKPKVIKDSLFDQGLDFLTRGGSIGSFMNAHDAILTSISPLRDSVFKASVVFLTKDDYPNSGRSKFRAIYEYNVDISKGGYYFINNIDLFMYDAIKTTDKGVTYYYRDTSHFLKSDANKTALLIETFYEKFPNSSAPQFDFIICKDVAELGWCLNLTHSHNVMTTGVASNPNSFLLSAKGSAYYPHETIHVIAPNYIPGFLWEGFATYFGGSGGENYAEFINSDTRLTEETITHFVEEKYYDWYYHYVFGALLCDYVFNDIAVKD